MILDISTQYFYDTLRVSAPYMRGMDTPTYVEMNIKENKKTKGGQRRERGREREKEGERQRDRDRERVGKGEIERERE